ncbi:hypothetical protein MSSIT_3642 [Methanosarcina siciliae T4/M]|uniref:Uncharacterized protein n=1 Tax=Methanosarcina siciliae T4/M TaxID=1434120 RepID=A0A0E3L9J1_9EURY|nr:hypothetical protein MSSIT_3642 [Methanosarcina siciliae T4/M]
MYCNCNCLKFLRSCIFRYYRSNSLTPRKILTFPKIKTAESVSARSNSELNSFSCFIFPYSIPFLMVI